MEQGTKGRPYGKWIGMGACLALFAALAAGVSAGVTGPLDAGGYRMVSLLRAPATTGFFRLYTNLAHPAALLAVSLLIVIFTPRKAFRLSVYINLILNTFLNVALKALFLRGRPADVAHLVNETGYSFPSGHAMAATAFYGFLIYLIWQGKGSQTKKRVCSALLGLGIFLICVSRVYLGVHYVSDVLAGCAVSAAYLILYCQVAGRYLTRGETEPLERNTGKKNEGLWASFVHAFDGVKESVGTERNLMIHFSAVAFVTLFGFLLGISPGEWLVCILFFALVIALELVNTAIESVVDICAPEKNELARLAKDAAAGAVLTAAAASVIAGAVIFLPKIWALIPTLLG